MNFLTHRDTYIHTQLTLLTTTTKNHGTYGKILQNKKNDTLPPKSRQNNRC